MSKQQKIDLKKYKAWSPLSNDPANVEYNNMYTRFLKYWKPTIIVGSVVCAIGAATYYAIIQPMRNPTKWQQQQKQNREGINPEHIQPGDMRVWSDPFNRKQRKSGSD